MIQTLSFDETFQIGNLLTELLKGFKRAIENKSLAFWQSNPSEPSQTPFTKWIFEILRSLRRPKITVQKNLDLIANRFSLANQKMPKTQQTSHLPAVQAGDIGFREKGTQSHLANQIRIFGIVFSLRFGDLFHASWMSQKKFIDMGSNSFIIKAPISGRFHGQAFRTRKLLKKPSDEFRTVFQFRSFKLFAIFVTDIVS